MDRNIIADYIGTNNFVFGKKWDSVPIYHDILRNEHWIYSTCHECETKRLNNGRLYKFWKFDNIPDKDEQEMIEWQTVDLLNNISSYSSVYDYKRTKSDVICGIYDKKLVYKMLTELANKYGTVFTKNLMSDIFIRGDNVLYNDKIYYFQPN